MLCDKLHRLNVPDNIVLEVLVRKMHGWTVRHYTNLLLSFTNRCFLPRRARVINIYDRHSFSFIYYRVGHKKPSPYMSANYVFLV